MCGCQSPQLEEPELLDVSQAEEEEESAGVPHTEGPESMNGSVLGRGAGVGRAVLLVVVGRRSRRSLCVMPSVFLPARPLNPVRADVPVSGCSTLSP